jgi:phosphate transport system substrate-binding protein
MLKHVMRRSALAVLLISIAVPLTAHARDYVSVVGSSTVYPFVTIVAEKFGQTSGFKTPVIEATGSGGGLKLFCAGIGLEHPDITNSSRPIKDKEAELCQANGVDYVEFIVGNDGIAMANSLEGAKFDISIAHIAAALAAELPGGGPDGDIGDSSGNEMKANSLKTWAEIDDFVALRTDLGRRDLPAIPIAMMIPPPTSGTRDAMGALFMKAGWEKLGLYQGASKQGYKRLREDGAVIEVGENDALIIEKLAADSGLFGIFGYSFFDQNRDKVQASTLDGIDLTFENIASYRYPGARPLFFYAKTLHLDVVPGMKAFLDEFISERAMGIDGYLFSAGLVPLSEDDFAKQMATLHSSN